MDYLPILISDQFLRLGWDALFADDVAKYNDIESRITGLYPKTINGLHDAIKELETLLKKVENDLEIGYDSLGNVMFE